MAFWWPRRHDIEYWTRVIQCLKSDSRYGHCVLVCICQTRGHYTIIVGISSVANLLLMHFDCLVSDTWYSNEQYGVFDTVECRYNAIQFDLILHALLQFPRHNRNQCEPTKTLHASPYRASHGVSFVKIFKKLTVLWRHPTVSCFILLWVWCLLG